MPWWQSAFSSSSFSKSLWDDSHWGVKHPLKASLIFPRRGGRQSTQPRKFRHVAHNDVEVRGSPSRAKPSAAQPSPQPLPLPELHVLLRSDPRLVPPNSGTVPPPSAHQHDKERARDRPPDAVKCGGDVNGANGIGRLAGQEARRSVEYFETRPVRRSSQPMNGTEKLPDNNGFNGPVSAPASAYSSPNRYVGDTSTPQYVNPPAWFQVWSAPEMPSSDITMEKTAFSVDNNPLQSPIISPGKTANIPPSGPTDPLPKGTSQANVRPLPLPPGPMPYQAAPVAHIKPVKSRWQKGKLLGRGTFGSVYAASNRETGALCAMKEVEILPDDTKSAECIKQLEQEIKVLSNLKHPNIVQYYGSEIAGDRFYIYLEYIHPGSLTRFIKDHCAAITESVVRNFTRHILCGLAYLHSKKTIHRDIKGANLLVDAFGVVKLADFGMAKHLAGHRANLSLKGSPYWMAPELLQSVMREEATADIALAADIWSLGCTIIEMLTGRPPWSEYEGAAAMFKVLKENPPIPDNLSEEGRDFLNCCFRRNPAERPSASMLLEHRFVKGPHQLDTIPSYSEITQTETIHSERENPSNRVDRVPLFYDTQSIKGKLVDKDPGQAFNQMGVSHLSPRSTLEALPGLSPPHSSH